MPDLAQGCVVRRTNSSASSTQFNDRNMIVSRVFATYSICLYLRKGKEYGYVFKKFKNSDLTVVVGADGTVAGGGTVTPIVTPAAGSLDLSRTDSSAVQSLM